MRGEPPPAGCEWLVIGYGNSLRSDDGAGLRVAEAVAAWGLPGVRSLAVHQLTPELAECLADAGRVLFVDARLAAEGTDIAVLPVEPSPSTIPAGHISDPRSLLALTRWLLGCSPRAWLLTIPGVAFEIGEEMSATATAGVGLALVRIAGMLEGEAPRPGRVDGGRSTDFSGRDPGARL